MSEHVTNSDRMNAFLAALAGPGDKNSPNNKSQRKEMLKIFGSAAELYEESLLTFVVKIALHLAKVIKENEPAYH